MAYLTRLLALLGKLRINRSLFHYIIWQPGFVFFGISRKKKILFGYGLIGTKQWHNNFWSVKKRMEKVIFKERSSVAKVMGTVLSLVGALVVVLYHGPRVFVASSPPLSSSNSDWIIGGCLLTIKDIFVSVSFILQVTYLYSHT